MQDGATLGVGNLWEIEKDDNGNVIQGKVVNEGSKNCYLNSESRLSNSWIKI